VKSTNYTVCHKKLKENYCKVKDASDLIRAYLSAKHFSPKAYKRPSSILEFLDLKLLKKTTKGE